MRFFHSTGGDVLIFHFLVGDNTVRLMDEPTLFKRRVCILYCCQIQLVGLRADSNHCL